MHILCDKVWGTSNDIRNFLLVVKSLGFVEISVGNTVYHPHYSIHGLLRILV